MVIQINIRKINLKIINKNKCIRHKNQLKHYKMEIVILKTNMKLISSMNRINRENKIILKININITLNTLINKVLKTKNKKKIIIFNLKN